jgi:hypothetical protein
MFDRWVIDATMGYPFCFCPVEGDLQGDYTIVTGMNVISDKPPHGGRLVGVVHADGQGAVEDFCDKYEKELTALSKAVGGESPGPAPLTVTGGN